MKQSVKRFSGIVVVVFVLAEILIGQKNQRTEKIISSPDNAMTVRIISVDANRSGSPESIIEMRTSKGSLIGIQKFISKDHEHGLGVVKAEWTPDSKFFVFSTIASGGQQPGHFPTFFYSRFDNKIHTLDHFVGIWVTDPVFYLQAPDLLYVTVRDKLTNGELADTLGKTVRLSSLRD